MTVYLNTQTHEYPRYAGDLNLLGWVVGQSLPENWEEVEETPMPETLDSEVAYEIEPKKVNNKWVQQWAIRDLTEQEVTMVTTPPPPTYGFPVWDKRTLSWVDLFA